MMTRGSLRCRKASALMCPARLMAALSGSSPFSGSSPCCFRRLSRRCRDAYRAPARGDFPGDDVEEPAAHEVCLHAHFQLVGPPIADVEESRLVDDGHALLQGGQIAEGLGTDQTPVTPVVEEVLARNGVEGADHFDPGAGDAFVQPVRAVAEDLD